MNIISKEYDVVVIGGGPGGLPAALAAARHGARVLLIEKNGYLGGNLALGLPLLGFMDKDGNRVINGIAQEFVDALREKEAAGEHKLCPFHNSITIYDHEILKVVALEKCIEAGIDILLHTEILEANVENGRLKSVELFGKSYHIFVKAQVFIDATGDGDLAYLAGARFETGKNNCGTVQPPTLICTVAGVDTDKTIQYIEEHPEQMKLSPNMQSNPGYDASYFRTNPDNHILLGLRKLFLDLKEQGILPVDRDTLIYIQTMVPGVVHINCTRHLGVDGSNLFDLTRAEIEGHLQNYAMIDVLRKYVPGFENCYLTQYYPYVGIRESRRFKGVKTLTGKDLLAGFIGEDTIGLGSFMIDIHDGKSNDSCVTKIGPYGLPYLMTCSADIDNLMLSGRCAGMDSVALGSVRVMPTIMTMGQGAGTGAALAVKNHIDPKEVDVSELRRILREDGAQLEPIEE